MRVLLLRGAGSGDFYLKLFKQALTSGSFILPSATAGSYEVEELQMQEASGIQSWYWKNVKLPALIKKAAPSILVWVDAMVENRFTQPQYLLITNTAVAAKTIDPDTATAKLLKAVLTYSQPAKEIIGETGLNAEKPVLAVELYQQAEATTAPKHLEALKLLNNTGELYFFAILAHKAEQQFINVLKAFSVFKKWQMSGMKLVLDVEPTDEMKQKLETFKYRSDVIIANAPGLVGDAYAVVYTETADSSYGGIMPLLKLGVPVIAQHNPSYEYLYKDAVYYCNLHDYKQLGTAMVELYRNERARTEMIDAGKALVQLVNS